MYILPVNHSSLVPQVPVPAGHLQPAPEGHQGVVHNIRLPDAPPGAARTVLVGQLRQVPVDLHQPGLAQRRGHRGGQVQTTLRNGDAREGHFSRKTGPTFGHHRLPPPVSEEDDLLPGRWPDSPRPQQTVSGGGCGRQAPLQDETRQGDELPSHLGRGEKYKKQG